MTNSSKKPQSYNTKPTTYTAPLATPEQIEIGAEYTTVAVRILCELCCFCNLHL